MILCVTGFLVEAKIAQKETTLNIPEKRVIVSPRHDKLPRPKTGQELLLVLGKQGAKFCAVESGTYYQLCPGDVIQAETLGRRSTKVQLTVMIIDGGPQQPKHYALIGFPDNDEPVLWSRARIGVVLRVLELVADSIPPKSIGERVGLDCRAF